MEEISSTERKVEVTLPKEEVTGKIEEVYKEVKKNAKIRGFRPGRAPRQVIEAHYKDYIFQETSSRLISESLTKALEEVSLNPISKPHVTPDKVAPDKDFHYSAVFEIIPAFEAKDYLRVQLKKKKPQEVTEEDVEKAIEELRRGLAEISPVEEEREVRAGDYLIIDYRGFAKEKPLKELSSSDVQVATGEEKLMKEFEENLYGMRKGEEKEFEITYPEDFQMKNLAGERIKFRVKLKDILEKKLPGVDDEFAKDVGEENLGELKKKIRGDLGKKVAQQIEEKLKKNLIEELLKRNPVEVPSILIEDEYRRLLREFVLSFQRQGIQLPPIGEEARGKFRERAINNLKAAFIFGDIAKKEGIGVSDEEVDEKLREIASNADLEFENVKEVYVKRGLVEDLKSRAIEEKIISFLLEKADIQEA